MRYLFLLLASITFYSCSNNPVIPVVNQTEYLVYSRDSILCTFADSTQNSNYYVDGDAFRIIDSIPAFQVRVEFDFFATRDSSGANGLVTFYAADTTDTHTVPTDAHKIETGLTFANNVYHYSLQRPFTVILPNPYAVYTSFAVQLLKTGTAPGDFAVLRNLKVYLIR